MKVAIYVRVSTLDQTTENQEKVLIDYCNNNNYEIYKIFKEEGISGYKVSRPQLDILMQELRLRNFDTLMIWKLDRLGRSLQHLLQIIQELKNKNIKLISVSEGFDTSTPQGLFFFQVVGAFAELERNIITERINLGIARAKKQGKHMGRPNGKKDSRPRNKLGYFQRFSKSKKYGKKSMV